MRNDVADNRIFSMQVRWAGDRCSVCDSDVDFDSDQLVSCDMCGITVHQSCYGVPELPGVDDMWLCRACELKVHHAQPLMMDYLPSCFIMWLVSCDMYGIKSASFLPWNCQALMTWGSAVHLS